MTSIMPSLGFRRQFVSVGRHPFLWIARDRLSLYDMSGNLGTYSASAVAATLTDSFGGTLSSNSNLPPWTYVSGQTVTGLLLNTGSREVRWQLDLIPQAMCWMVDFVENGGLGTASGGVAYLGAVTATGGRVYIDSTGTQYRATYTDGTTTRTCTMTGTAPTSGQRVRLRLILSSTGTIQLGQSINGLTETLPAASAATTLPATWGGTNFYLNRVAAGSYGTNIYVAAVVMIGNQTAAYLQAALT